MAYRADEFGCKPSCTTTVYKKQVEGYARNTFAIALPSRSFRAPNEYKFYTKIVSPKVEVLKEYEIYDFNGILGSVGGSLGLFVGFSFLDCLLNLVNRAYYWNLSLK